MSTLPRVTLDADAETILSALPDLLFRIGRDGTFRGFCAADPSDLVAPPERIVGATVRELLPPPVAERVMENLEAVIADGADRHFVYALPIRGEERWFEARMVRSRPDESLTIVRDVSALKHEERRFATLVAAVDAIVWEGRVEGDLVEFHFVSDRADAILGFPAARWYEPGFWRSRIHDEDRDAVCAECAEAVARGEDHRLEYRMIAADGRVVWLRDIVRVFSGGVCRGLMIDVTERKALDAERRRIREQLVSSQKLESLGLLAGGIAHDFNNLLTAIIGNASLLLLRLAADSPHRRLVEEIDLAADRATALTRQILAYSGKGALELRRFDVSAAIRDIEPLLRTSTSSAVSLELDLDENLPIVEGDPSQLQQVVMNLVLNGADALEGRPGRVRVATREVAVDTSLAGTFDVGANVRAGRYVRVEVSDTGRGMSAECAARALDPFFTTKPAGRGLGLAAVVGIVRSHGAGLRIETAPGRGATFSVFFPAGAGAPDEVHAREERPARDGRGLLLVIDDEPALRTFAREALASFGYEVVVAPDGRAGVERFARLGGRVDLVVLDVTMPVMSGPECLAALRVIDPHVRVLVVSGYDEATAEERAALEGCAGFLQKPFSAQALAAKVEALLASKA
ncbi:MAG: response regulator [Sandaracinaceae bacterium]|nr:response regulator [Sandaracinaceae bacterium]